ncbi:molecular chaperone [Pseudomonas taiwanensis]|uniref:fimbrial biogenesis chaperone n=1 Tax=Pseudomonas taiwanensis TaxID=470150 RepID=UPI0028DDE495|nr:molecular chaperone [Pseudomonas taiwanensis]MDT8921772.1 molecular chaperone [Pseudomonas taiwanensis]
MKTLFFSKITMIGVLTCFASLASAGIMIGGTRVIYTEPSKEASIMVINQSAQDIMIQSWIDPEDKQDSQNVPFIVTPPLSRLGGNKQQVLRILYSGETLPADRESVFRLNVQEIPQKSKDNNSLQIAVRQRIKLFYRPIGIEGKPDDAPKMLQWRLVEKLGKPAVEVWNPSSFNVSFSGAMLHSGSSKFPIPIGMIAPKSKQIISIQGLVSSKHDKAGSIEFTAINDYGGHDSYSSKLSH